jgi:hypothetical protein
MQYVFAIFGDLGVGREGTQLVSEFAAFVTSVEANTRLSRTSSAIRHSAFDTVIDRRIIASKPPIAYRAQ